MRAPPAACAPGVLAPAALHGARGAGLQAPAPRASPWAPARVLLLRRGGAAAGAPLPGRGGVALRSHESHGGGAIAGAVAVHPSELLRSPELSDDDIDVEVHAGGLVARGPARFAHQPAVAADAQAAPARAHVEAMPSLLTPAQFSFRPHCTDCVAVLVKFQWDAAWGGSRVELWGSFNSWQEGFVMDRDSAGNHALALTLEPGVVTYKYKVDGNWRISLREPQVADDKRNVNNSLTVSDSATFRWKRAWGGSRVFVTGSDSGWRERVELQADDQPGSTDLVLRKHLPVGSHTYKFIVDGKWRLSPEEPTVKDAAGELNNQMVVAQDATVTVFYKTGWATPRLVVGSGGDDALVEVPFSPLPARSGGLWKSVSVPAALGVLDAHAETCPMPFDAPATAAAAADERPRAAALEFVVSDGASGVDVPPGGGRYRCPWPGAYKLERGALKPFPRARAPPMLLVSDLDGTMVGPGADFDAATRRFRVYWENNAQLAGSVLCYNTGRSIGQVVSLLEEKQGALAVPDVVITAVGTKVFHRDADAEGRDVWREDMEWSASLDAGWDLKVVQAAAAAVISAHDGRVSWLDRGTEHPHRVALSVSVEALDAVRARLEALFATAHCEARIIVSGVGGWRYVDVVAAGAGKLEALEYVRKLYRMPHERTVAAGDSGNDQLMLGGKHYSLLVGNSQPDLLAWHLDQPQTGRCVLTDEHGAAGILEGLARLQLY